MKEVLVKVIAESGLHGRPATEVIRFAKQFESKITLINGKRKGNCSSLISILAAKIKQNDEIIISAEGPDEVEAAEKLKNFISMLEDKFEFKIIKAQMLLSYIKLI